MKFTYVEKYTMPDDLSYEDMYEYGYEWMGMLPLRAERAKYLFRYGAGKIYSLYDDNIKVKLDSLDEIDEADAEGIMLGINRKDFEEYLKREHESIKDEMGIQMEQRNKTISEVEEKHILSYDSMCCYGYTWEAMLPITADYAKHLFCDNAGLIFALHTDNTEDLLNSLEEIDEADKKGLMFGIKKEAYEGYKKELSDRFEEYKKDKNKVKWEIYHGTSHR